jgi:Flp pilus assembly CpaE family ATPase
MTSLRAGRPLPVLVVCPDRRLGALFSEAAAAAGCFEVLAEVSKYAPSSMLEIRFRQLRPAAVVVDLATDPAAACDVIRLGASQDPPVPAVGLDHSQRPEIVMQALRAGACEFLTPPFSLESQRQAADAVRRLAAWDETEEVDHGQVLAFASVKPGCGASALATHAALELAGQTGRRVLLADLDLAGGSISFYTGVEHPYSILDLLEQDAGGEPAPALSVGIARHGVEILPAPAVPRVLPLEGLPIKQTLERLRRAYDWVILDLPVIFQPASLIALAESDRTYLVTCPDLGSLHAGRKAVRLLNMAGATPERFEVVLNRAGRKDGGRLGEIGQILGRKIHAVFPEDHGALHAAAATAGRLDPGSPLREALIRWVETLTGVRASVPRNRGLILAQGAALAGT